MFCGNGLLGFLLGDLVGFRGDESDELDATFYEEITSIFCKGEVVGEDLLDDFLDGGWTIVNTSSMGSLVSLYPELGEAGTFR